jgi:enoyl-CoA hydratase/carnithine racemase
VKVTGTEASRKLPAPRQLIACLYGHAFGGGIELSACADFRVAEGHAQIGAPETAIGVIPCGFVTHLEDNADGVRSFQKKRTPTFRGK